MAENEGCRVTGEAIVKCLTPDVCLDASGKPVPFQIIARFSNTVRDVPTVRMTGMNVMTMDSRLTTVYGDELGVGGGIISGVNKGHCRPITHSTTVRAKGHHLIYHSALYWMNCDGPEGPGNTQGAVIYVENIDCVSIGPLGEIEGDTNPIPAPQTKEEESWWETGLSWLHNGLDVVGLIPVLGEAADGVNAAIHGVEAVIYLTAGNKAKAAENAAMGVLSAAAMLPIGGQAATAAKLTIRAGKEVVEEGGERLLKEGVEESLEQLGKEGAQEAGEQAAKHGTSNGVRVSTTKIKSADQCRKELRENLGDPPSGLKNPQAHHDLPVKFQEEFAEHGIDINKAQNGRWVEGTPPGTHQRWSKEFNKEWRQFFDDDTIPKNHDTIVDKMQELRNDSRFQ